MSKTTPKVTGQDLKDFLINHGFDAQQVADISLPEKRTKSLSFSPSERARIQWRPAACESGSWSLEIRYRFPKDHRLKIYVPLGYVSPVALAAFDRLEEESRLEVPSE